MKCINDLKGKNCLFLGAASPFARELCRNLAKLQLNFGFVDLQPRNSQKFVKELENIGVKATSVKVAPGDVDSFKGAVKTIEQSLGAIDYLICSYYFEEDEEKNYAIDKLEMEQWDSLRENWLDSYFLMAKAVLPSMLSKKEGKMIFLNLASGYTGSEGMGQLTDESSLYYSVCSSAITGAVTSMAREIIPLGIKVNGIALTSTDFKEDNKLLKIVVFLLSELSYYVCGQFIRLD
ncbi:MAG: SDR family NAD(P)-dependent oxidoreductase [Candidatus Heimdallarchaeota archaeon]|nr:SDR family NAD(P)-dependent oxidoreductase [Candidatus Heimdallarchaeota archaeon]